jgi:hypothetical protein
LDEMAAAMLSRWEARRSCAFPDNNRILAVGFEGSNQDGQGEGDVTSRVGGG